MSFVCYLLARARALPPQELDQLWLAPVERARATGLLPKRRHDFRLGRWVAKQALRSLLGPGTPSLDAIEIAANPDGAPLVCWSGGQPPAQISLSHREDLGLCTLFSTDLALGCDLELVEPRSEAFLVDFFTESEQTRVAAAGELRWLAAALIWSAKESCFKALRTGLRRDTRSVEVTMPELPASNAASEWRLLQAVDLEAAGAEAGFSGWWLAREGFVLTVMGRGTVPVPRELVDRTGRRPPQTAHSSP